MMMMMNSAAENNTLLTEDEASNLSTPEATTLYAADLLSQSVNDSVTAQLVAAGPIGVAAATAICSAKKRKRPHVFEINPSVRKRHQTRLLRKLRTIIDEYSVRVGQQAVVLTATPGKPQNNYRVFGAHPLEDVVRKCKSVIMQELETSLAEQAPPQMQDDPSLHDLPPLVIDGIPTPVEKMTQAQLRTFIPLMLRYSTGRGKPGWGRESTKPQWWPKDLPWANVRSDARSEDAKLKVSWTHALRQIVINCYKYHGREDLLPHFSDDEEKGKPVFATETNINALTSSVLQAVNNTDGSVNIIHVDPGSAVVTLADGTQAEVRALNWSDISRPQDSVTDASQTVQAIMNVAAQLGGVNDGAVAIDIKGDAIAQAVSTIQEATINQDGHIILTGADGSQNSYPLASMVTIPASMYQSLVAHLSEVQNVQTNIVQSSEIVVKAEGANEATASSSNANMSTNMEDR